jgi:hypothetical protein
MARRGVIGNDRLGPVAESVDAGAVHRSLSWFKSRPGLHPSPLCGFGSACQPPPRLARHIQAGLPRRSSQSEGGAKMPVDWSFKTLSRLRNLV